jgi:hypothetical protein
MTGRVDGQYKGEEQSLHRSFAHARRLVFEDIGRVQFRLGWDVQHKLTPQYCELQFLWNGVG